MVARSRRSGQKEDYADFGPGLAHRAGRRQIACNLRPHPETRSTVRQAAEQAADVIRESILAGGSR
jgi:hypothetical protein